MVTPSIASYPISGQTVPHMPTQPVHLPDFAAISRRTSEFGDARVPGQTAVPYLVGDPYRPNSAPGMSYHIDPEVPMSMGNKRRRLEQEGPGDSRTGSITIKPEISRTSSVLGSYFPLTSDAARLQPREVSRRQSPLPAPPPAPREAPESASLAETTARLARLERLLTLQDHTYAEKRLRLAEEAALRMLEGGGEASDPGSKSSAAQQSRHVAVNGQPESSDQRLQHRQEQGLQIDVSATEASAPPHSRILVTGSTDHDDESGDHLSHSAEVKARFGRWNTVEIIGDAGYTGAEGLNALTAASVLVSVDAATCTFDSDWFTRRIDLRARDTARPFSRARVPRIRITRRWKSSLDCRKSRLPKLDPSWRYCRRSRLHSI